MQMVPDVYSTGNLTISILSIFGVDILKVLKAILPSPDLLLL
jgi:hypothetical protein